MSSLAVLGPDVTEGGDGAVIGITDLEKVIIPSIQKMQIHGRSNLQRNTAAHAKKNSSSTAAFRVQDTTNLNVFILAFEA